MNELNMNIARCALMVVAFALLFLGAEMCTVAVVLAGAGALAISGLVAVDFGLALALAWAVTELWIAKKG